MNRKPHNGAAKYCWCPYMLHAIWCRTLWGQAHEWRHVNDPPHEKANSPTFARMQPIFYSRNLCLCVRRIIFEPQFVFRIQHSSLERVVVAAEEVWRSDLVRGGLVGSGEEAKSYRMCFVYGSQRGKTKLVMRPIMEYERIYFRM